MSSRVLPIAPQLIQAVQRSVSHPGRFLEWGLALPLAAGALYKVGKFSREGNEDSSEPKLLLTGLMEAAATAALVQYSPSKLLFPGLVGAWTLFQMGRTHRKEEIPQTVVSEIALFSVGYLGIVLGQTYNHWMNRLHALRILQWLQKADVKTGSNPALSTLHTQLAPELKQLRKTTSRVAYTLPKHGTENTMTVALEKVSALEEKLLKTISDLSDRQQKQLLQKANRSLKTLLKEIGQKQSRQLLQLLNPAFGYLIMLTLAAPLVPQMLEKLFPNLPTHEGKVFPLWLAGLMPPSDPVDHAFEALVRQYPDARINVS